MEMNNKQSNSRYTLSSSSKDTSKHHHSKNGKKEKLQSSLKEKDHNEDSKTIGRHLSSSSSSSLSMNHPTLNHPTAAVSHEQGGAPHDLEQVAVNPTPTPTPTHTSSSGVARHEQSVGFNNGNMSVGSVHKCAQGDLAPKGNVEFENFENNGTISTTKSKYRPITECLTREDKLIRFVNIIEEFTSSHSLNWKFTDNSTYHYKAALGSSSIVFDRRSRAVIINDTSEGGDCVGKVFLDKESKLQEGQVKYDSSRMSFRSMVVIECLLEKKNPWLSLSYHLGENKEAESEQSEGRFFSNLVVISRILDCGYVGKHILLGIVYHFPVKCAESARMVSDSTIKETMEASSQEALHTLLVHCLHALFSLEDFKTHGSFRPLRTFMDYAKEVFSSPVQLHETRQEGISVDMYEYALDFLGKSSWINYFFKVHAYIPDAKEEEVNFHGYLQLLGAEKKTIQYEVVKDLGKMKRAGAVLMHCFFMHGYKSHLKPLFKDIWRNFLQYNFQSVPRLIEKYGIHHPRFHDPRPGLIGVMLELNTKTHDPSHGSMGIFFHEAMNCIVEQIKRRGGEKMGSWILSRHVFALCCDSYSDKNDPEAACIEAIDARKSLLILNEVIPGFIQFFKDMKQMKGGGSYVMVSPGAPSLSYSQSSVDSLTSHRITNDDSRLDTSGSIGDSSPSAPIEVNDSPNANTQTKGGNGTKTRRKHSSGGDSGSGSDSEKKATKTKTKTDTEKEKEKEKQEKEKKEKEEKEKKEKQEKEKKEEDEEEEEKEGGDEDDDDDDDDDDEGEGEEEEDNNTNMSMFSEDDAFIGRDVDDEEVDNGKGKSGKESRKNTNHSVSNDSDDSSNFTQADNSQDSKTRRLNKVTKEEDFENEEETMDFPRRSNLQVVDNGMHVVDFTPKNGELYSESVLENKLQRLGLYMGKIRGEVAKTNKNFLVRNKTRLNDMFKTYQKNLKNNEFGKRLEHTLHKVRNVTDPRFNSSMLTVYLNLLVSSFRSVELRDDPFVLTDMIYIRNILSHPKRHKRLFFDFGYVRQIGVVLDDVYDVPAAFCHIFVSHGQTYANIYGAVPDMTAFDNQFKTANSKAKEKEFDPRIVRNSYGELLDVIQKFEASVHGARYFNTTKRTPPIKTIKSVYADSGGNKVNPKEQRAIVCARLAVEFWMELGFSESVSMNTTLPKIKRDLTDCFIAGNAQWDDEGMKMDEEDLKKMEQGESNDGMDENKGKEEKEHEEESKQPELPVKRSLSETSSGTPAQKVAKAMHSPQSSAVNHSQAKRFVINPLG